MLNFLLTSCDFTPPLYKKILHVHKYIAVKNYEESIHQYKEILKSNPPTDIEVKIHYQLGELYSIHLFDNNNALKYYNLVKQKTSDPLWLVKAEERLGDINYSFLKNYHESYKNYKRLTEFIPKLKKYDFFKYRMALSIFNNNKYDFAYKIFNEINKDIVSEYYSKTFYYLGMIHYLQQEWEKAILQWEKYIAHEKRKDNIIQAKFLMGNAYESLEEYKKAYNLYYSILGDYPNTEVVKSRLNAIYYRQIARNR